MKAASLGDLRVRGATRVPPAPAVRPAPIVAILCPPACGRAAAAGIALALAQEAGRRCGIASAVGGGDIGSLGGLPVARRAATAVGGRGLSTTVSGRLVWLPDRRAADVEVDADAPVRVAALSAAVGRAAAAAEAPAAIAIPCARTAALDRVLGWHDALVLVRDADASDAMLERALTSLAALGRPVAAMAPPPRLAAMLALGGVQAPAEAVRVIAELGLADERRG